VITSNPTESDIARLQEASEWVQRLSESSDQAHVDEWMEWCKTDSRNLVAFEQMQRIWGDFFDAEPAGPLRRPATPRRHRNRLFALAAGVLLLVGAAGWFALRFTQVETFDTAIGEQRRIALFDGSQLDLAPDSRVSTNFTLSRRNVRLERGQAFFTVAHSAVRPFVVKANDLTVTAVGTAFDVRTGPSTTVVTVSEGRVKVTPAASGSADIPGNDAEPLRAGVGQQVTFSKPTRRLSVAAVDPKAAGSWRAGTLQFIGEPLEDVVGELNRYSGRKIAVTSAFQQTRFTGTVAPAHVGDWLKALEQIYAVDVVDLGANGIQIQSREKHEARK
jgi:transmembrane sensor